MGRSAHDKRSCEPMRCCATSNPLRLRQPRFNGSVGISGRHLCLFYVSPFTFYLRVMNIFIKDINATVQRILEYPVLPKSGITVGSLLLLIVLFGLVVLGERIFRRQFMTRVLRRTHLAPGLQFTLSRVLGYCILGLGFYISLQTVGVNLSSLAVF